MAKAKIKGLDKAIDEVFKDYKKANKEAAKRATEKAKKDLYANAVSCLEAYYNDYDPTSYERTYSLLDSFVPYAKEVQEVGDDLICTAGVRFDPSLVTYYSSWSYSQINQNGSRQMADSEWIIANFLAGIHPRTDGSREPGGGNYEYRVYYGSFVPAEEMQRFIDRYHYTFERNFRRELSKEILRNVRR